MTISGKWLAIADWIIAAVFLVGGIVGGGGCIIVGLVGGGVFIYLGARAWKSANT